MTRERSSFRDPAGYVVHDAGAVKRVITASGVQDYDQLIGSGLYAHLVEEGLLVEHHEEARSSGWPSEAVKVIVPRKLPFISYPYEWSFHQLRDAALLTLDLQQRALSHGLSMKDASAYNVQFEGCRPVFIDTLSFEADSGGPWIVLRPVLPSLPRAFAVDAIPLARFQSSVENRAGRLQRAMDIFPVALAHILAGGRAIPHSFPRPLPEPE